MGYLIFLLISLVLFAGFIWLTRFESRRGMRVLSRQRDAFDGSVERLAAALSHVDAPELLHDGARAFAVRAAHDLAHGALVLVRFIERSLTHAVRTIRTRHFHTTTPGTAGPTEFVATMKDFKDELRNGRSSGEEAQ